MIKRTILYIISTIMLVFGFMGCTDNYNPYSQLEPSLSARWIKPSKTSFSYYGPHAFTETFLIESFDTPWKFTGVASWLTLTPESGKSTANVTLTAEENTNAKEARTTIFYLSSDNSDWNYSRAISVSQGKAKASLSINETALSFGGGASQQKITVDANCTWTASCSSTWVSLSPNNATGELTISVTPNPDDSYRNSTVYIYYDQGYITIDITQIPATITSSADTLQYEKDASKYDLLIDSEADWTSTTSHSWISVSPANGKAGKNTVSIEVAPNSSVSSRNGYVTFEAGSADKIQIKIIQKGFYIEVNDPIILPSIKGTQKLHIHSNTNWSITEYPEWLTLSKLSGELDDDIVITTDDNSNTIPQTGEIVIEQPGLELRCVVAVTQLGKSLSPEKTLLELPAESCVQSFNIVSDASWTSTILGDWFSATPTSGQGNAVITVSAQENNSTNEREGVITYTYLNQNKTVDVRQQAKYMIINDRSFKFDSKGGSHYIEIYTNDNCVAEIEGNPSWLKLSTSVNEEKTVLNLTAEDNASVNSRSAVVLVSSKFAQSIKIVVTQSGRYLTVSTQNVLFFSDGGKSDAVKIFTDGSFNISSNCDWFSIDKESNNSFTVTAQQNNTKQARKGSITISLTNLQEGSYSIELTVLQVGEGGSFVIAGYPEDDNWDAVNNGALSIKVKKYSLDKNWDATYGGTLNIKVSGYNETDKDWNE